MILPLQITFRNMRPSAAVERWIRDEAAKLDEFYSRIMGCRVVVELPNRRHRQGSRFHVRIDLTVPGGELVVKQGPTLHSSLQRTHASKLAKHLEIHVPHRDLRQAIDDAFKAMGRRLQDYARRQRGDLKAHEPLPRACVSKLMLADGFGFLETPGGREIYFHANSVLNGGFERLGVGTTVSFAEEEGDKGPQASTVKVLRERHLHPPARMACTGTLPVVMAQPPQPS
jgi:cold shock CspA family protein/ribosome-associated translation inhibitor RaiA